MKHTYPGRIGLALGSGAARGWAHVGVIRALEAAGIHPEIVCGSSVGAVVGAAYASGRLDEFEKWVLDLDRSGVVRNLDLSFRGGLFKGTQFFSFMSPSIPDCEISTLERPFAAVATDLESGREIWLRSGSLHAALRASVALPGLITPARRDGRWLVDGGLVNPVPVSLCRVLGADVVIAVDLNTRLLRRSLTAVKAAELEPGPDPELDHRLERELAERALVPIATSETRGDGADDEPDPETNGLRSTIEFWARELRDRFASDSDPDTLPSLYEVLANSLNVMQVQITRSRMAGDPADVLIAPRLESFALLDLDRGAEAIEEGRRATNQVLASISHTGASPSEPSGNA